MRTPGTPCIVDIINLSSSADTLLRERVLALRAKGVDNHILCMDGPYVKTLRAAGIPVGTMHLPRGVDPFKLAWSLLEITSYLRRVKPDLVHTHCSVPGIIGRLAARLAGVPVVMHTVHGFHFHDGGHGLSHRLAVAAEVFAGRFTHVMLSQNRADMEQALRLGIVSRDRLHYVGNGIAVDEFASATHERTTDGTLVITCVARMEPVKNHAMLLDAVALLAARGVAFELWLIGGGAGRDVLAARAASLGISARVRFMGYRDDIPALLGRSDIGVLTSLKEGIPRAALESMASGLPMVATRVNGSREVVRDGDTGFLVDVGDVAGLTAALERLARDPELRMRMGERGREVVRAEFDEAIIVRRLARLYGESLTRRGIPVPPALKKEAQA